MTYVQPGGSAARRTLTFQNKIAAESSGVRVTLTAHRMSPFGLTLTRKNKPRLMWHVERYEHFRNTDVDPYDGTLLQTNRSGTVSRLGEGFPSARDMSRCARDMLATSALLRIGGSQINTATTTVINPP